MKLQQTWPKLCGTATAQGLDFNSSSGSTTIGKKYLNKIGERRRGHSNNNGNNCSRKRVMCTFSNFVTLLTLPNKLTHSLSCTWSCTRSCTRSCALSTNLLVNNRRRQPGGLRNNYDEAAGVGVEWVGLGRVWSEGNGGRVTNDLICCT